MAGKKAAEEISSRDKRKALIAGLQKRFPGKVFRGGDYTMPWAVRRLPTGILDLDLALGGGLPAGGLNVITGKPGAGKNWIANQVIRIQQQIRGEDAAVAVIGTEIPYDKGQAHGCGVRVPFSGEEMDAYLAECAFLGIEPTPEDLDLRTEEIGDFVVVPPSTAEESFDIAIELVKSREFDIIVLDSFGSLLTTDDADKDFTDKVRVGGPSGLNTRLMKKLCSALSTDSKGRPNLTCFLGINQVRDNMNKKTPYSPDLIESGGWALKHGRLVTLNLSRIGALKKGKVHYGKQIRWELLKVKAVGHEGPRGDYSYVWKDMSFNHAELAVKLGAVHGIIEKSGSWYSFDGERMGQGLDKAGAWLMKAGLLEKVEIDTFKAAGVRRYQ